MRLTHLLRRLHPATPRLRLDFYTRRGCHLCEEVEPLIRKLARECGAEVRIHDVDDSESLRERYGDRIPVVRINDGNQLALRITEARLRRALARARARSG